MEDDHLNELEQLQSLLLVELAVEFFLQVELKQLGGVQVLSRQLASLQVMLCQSLLQVLPLQVRPLLHEEWQEMAYGFDLLLGQLSCSWMQDLIAIIWILALLLSVGELENGLVARVVSLASQFLEQVLVFLDWSPAKLRS